MPVGGSAALIGLRPKGGSCGLAAIGVVSPNLYSADSQVIRVSVMRQALMSNQNRVASTRDLAETLFVVLSIFFLLGVFGGLETLIFAIGSSAWPQDEIGSRAVSISLGVMALRVSVAACLIRYRRRISEFLVPEGDLPGLHPRDLFSVVLSAVGAFLFVTATTKLVSLIALNGSLEEIMSVVVWVALSVALFLRSRQLAGVWDSKAGFR